MNQPERKRNIQQFVGAWADEELERRLEEMRVIDPELWEEPGRATADERPKSTGGSEAAKIPNG